MKFSAREDVTLPIGQVFARLADFAAHERTALRRGIQVARLDDLRGPEPGMVWSARFRFRGRMRDLAVELVTLEDPEAIRYAIDGSGLAGQFDIDLVALSARRTRIAVALEIKPQTLTGRLLIQSLRMIKPTLNRRFKGRVEDYAATISDRADTPGL